MAALDSKSPRSSKNVSKKSPQKTSTKAPAPRKNLNDKPHVSADEIRAKLAKKDEPAVKVETKVENRISMAMNDNFEEVQRRGEEAKRLLAQKKQAEEEAKIKAQPLSQGEGQESELPTERPSDVGKNNPQDPATVGKLKDLLSKGGFNFSEKEKAALSKILT